MAVLFAPAIILAEKGFVITEGEARGLNSAQDEFQKFEHRDARICKRNSMESR